MTDIQVQFFKRVKDLLPMGAILANELSDLLNISTDSAYRRIRGETPLSLIEADLISQHYRISLSDVGHLDSGMVSFSYYNMENTLDHFRGYLTHFRDSVLRISKIPNVHINYLSQDIPLFYNVQHGYLAAFKLFYWMRSVLGIAELRNARFDINLIPKDLLEIGREIHALYCQVPSAEIWTESTIGSTLRQIQFFWESGLFSRAKDALKVCEDMRFVFEQLHNQADTGRKSINGHANGSAENFKLYVSEVEITNNCAQVDIGEMKAVFLGHHTFNMLETTQPHYCQQTADWFKRIIAKSTLISTVSEIYRYKFFNNAIERIDKLQEHIRSQSPSAGR